MLLYIEPLPSILVWSGTSLYVVIYWATSQHFGLIWDFAICCYILSHFPAFWFDLGLSYMLLYIEPLPSILVWSGTLLHVVIYWATSQHFGLIWDFAICCYILSHFPAFWSALGLCYMLLYIEPLPSILVWSWTLLYVVIYWALPSILVCSLDFAICCYILSHFPTFWSALGLCFMLLYIEHFPTFWSDLGLCYMLLYIEPLPSILKIYTRVTYETLLAESSWSGQEKFDIFSFLCVCSSLSRIIPFRIYSLITKTCLLILYSKTGVFKGIHYFSFAKSIDCGYSLELPHWGSSNKYPQSMFWAGIWKISEFFLSENFPVFPVLVVKFSIYLNRLVSLMVCNNSVWTIKALMRLCECAG